MTRRTESRSKAFGIRTLLAVAAFAALAGADEPKPESPVALACDAAGNIYIADSRLPGIYKRDRQGALEVVFRGSPKNRTPLHSPRALTVAPDGSLLAADSATSEVYRLVSGQPPLPLTRGSLEVPTGLALTPEGDIIATDLRLGTVSRIAQAGGAPELIAQVPAPRGVAVRAGRDIVVLSMGPDQLVRVAPDGTVRPIVSGRPFRFPIALLLGRELDGYVVSDSYAATVWSISDNGEVRPMAQGAPLVRPGGMARDPSGALLVADPGARQVFRITAEGDIQPLL